MNSIGIYLPGMVRDVPPEYMCVENNVTTSCFHSRDCNYHTHAVSHVEDMRDMFAYAYSFNQDISQWDGRISRHVMAFACRTRTPEEAERRRSRLKKWFLRRGTGRDTGDTARAEYANREGKATASLQRSFEQSLRSGAHLQRSRGGGANVRGNGGEDSGRK